jgi:hypothetical protein
MNKGKRNLRRFFRIFHPPISEEMKLISATIHNLLKRDEQFYNAIQKRELQIISNRAMTIPLEIKPNA